MLVWTDGSVNCRVQCCCPVAVGLVTQLFVSHSSRLSSCRLLLRNRRSGINSDCRRRRIHSMLIRAMISRRCQAVFCRLTWWRVDCWHNCGQFRILNQLPSWSDSAVFDTSCVHNNSSDAVTPNVQNVQWRDRPVTGWRECFLIGVHVMQRQTSRCNYLTSNIHFKTTDAPIRMRFQMWCSKYVSNNHIWRYAQAESKSRRKPTSTRIASSEFDV